MMMLMIEYMGHGLRFYRWLGIGTHLMSPMTDLFYNKQTTEYYSTVQHR